MSDRNDEITEVLAAHALIAGIRDLRKHCTCGWVSEEREGVATHRAHLAAVLAERERRVKAEVLREALDPREPPGMLRAMLIDAANRLDNPAHKGNAHPWPKHAAMFRRAADLIEGGDRDE